MLTENKIEAGTIYIWTTKNCSVGCRHCNYSSTNSKFNKTTYLSDNFEKLMSFIKDSNAWKVVLTGGGEPMLEKQLCYKIISKSFTNRLREIELITSGFWAKNAHNCDFIIDELLNNFNNNTVEKLIIRLSIGYYHKEKLGLQHVVNIVNNFCKNKGESYDLVFRSELVGGDNTIKEIADIVGGNLSDISDYSQELILNNGLKITIYYKNIILDGRLNKKILEEDGFFIPSASKAENFVKRCLIENNYIPSQTYNHIHPILNQGMSFLIENTGRVEVHESTAPDIITDFSNGWSYTISQLFNDSLTKFLIENGPRKFFELIGELELYLHTMRKHNQIDDIIIKILSSQEIIRKARLITNKFYNNENRNNYPLESYR